MKPCGWNHQHSTSNLIGRGNGSIESKVKLPSFTMPALIVFTEMHRPWVWLISLWVVFIFKFFIIKLIIKIKRIRGWETWAGRLALCLRVMPSLGTSLPQSFIHTYSWALSLQTQEPNMSILCKSSSLGNWVSPTENGLRHKKLSACLATKSVLFTDYSMKNVWAGSASANCAFLSKLCQAVDGTAFVK